MSLLPNIVEVADSHGLDCNFKTRGKKEVMFKCPFCHADSNKNRFYLSLNEDKNVFKCWHCKESGGVLRFISLLDGKSEEKLIEQVRKKSGSTYKKHPAEQLTRSQLELIGYPKIDWIKNRDYDVELYKNYRERVYQDWTSHVKKEKELCYKLLFTGLLSNNLSSAIASCKQKEFELQEKFVDELIKMLFQESKYEVFEVEMNVSELMKIQHPYDTL